ncbi:MAG TPA: C25 family cysteine peptidase, partial [Cytophagales bacterium]|nr:C25 family cysteine peptidase [Cytophagales bacterium]
MIVTHEHFQKPSTSYANPVRAYAEYRASLTGGAYDTAVYNTEYLYDYFTYGDHTPLAIRKLCEKLCADVTKVPKALLLVGKGYGRYDASRNYDPNRYGYVPTWNDPGSDIPFSMGLAGNKKYVQAIPTGRLSVKSAQQVENYLHKLLEHEQVDDGTLWKKTVVHLSGGSTNEESIGFKNIMAAWTAIAKRPYFGAFVKTYAKTLDEEVQIFDLGKQLNEGANLVNILGHSSAQINDVRIGSVNDPSFSYANKGKYPILIMNGCESGNIFGETDSKFDIFSETWVNEPDKGSIAFYAHSNLGVVPEFVSYNRIMYETWFGDSANISKPFGEIIRLSSSKHVSDFDKYTDNNVRHIHQMTLMGDPLAKLFRDSKIDYAIESRDVDFKSLDGNPITALTDTFLLTFVVKNLGILHKDQKIYITIKRTPSAGQEVMVRTLYTNFVTSSDTFKVKVGLGDISSAGVNNFSIEIDSDNIVNERLENNNTVIVPRFLPASNMNCLFPKEFSIQNKKVLNLVAQSSDLLREEEEYLFEIDTSFSFNSPAYQSKTVTATSLPTWENVNLFERISPNADSVEFFWRVRFNVQGQGNPISLYSHSSFIYITNGNSGWNQSKFHQFDKDQLSANVVRDTTGKKFDFVDYNLRILVKASEQTSADPVDSNQLYINSKPIYNSSFFPRWDGWLGNTGFVLSAYDSKTLRVYRPNAPNTLNPQYNYIVKYSNELVLARFFVGGREGNPKFQTDMIEDLIT